MNCFVPLRFLPLVLIAALTFTACDSSDPDEDRVGISGDWSGTLTNGADPTQMFPVTFTMVDDRSIVTGSGTVQLPTETLSFQITSGLFAPPNLSIALRFDRPPQGTLSGIVSVDRDFIDGTMSGPGLVNGEVELMLSLQRME